MLERGQFEPILASNGEEALQLFSQSLCQIALVLSDVGMPLMDGISMARKMFELNPDSHILLMSGSDADELVPSDVKRLCATINKPFTPAQLLEAVKECLE